MALILGNFRETLNFNPDKLTNLFKIRIEDFLNSFDCEENEEIKRD